MCISMDAEETEQSDTPLLLGQVILSRVVT